MAAALRPLAATVLAGALVAAEPALSELHLREAPMAAAAALIAEAGGGNVVVSRGARETVVSARLRRVSPAVAIETLCRMEGLWFRHDENGVSRILSLAEYQDDLVAVRDAQTRLLPVRYPSAASLAEQISQLYGERLVVATAVDRDPWTGAEESAEISPVAAGSAGGESQGGPMSRQRAARLEERIRLSVSESGNALVLRSADLAALDAITALVAALDRPTPQVLLEVKILEVRLRDGEETAVGIGFTDGGTPRSAPFVSNGLATLSDGSILDRLIDDEISRLFDSGLRALTTAHIDGGLVYRYLDDHLDLTLRALASEERLSTLGTPLILAADNRESLIDIGEERPVVTDGEVVSVQTGSDGNNNPVFQPVQTPAYESRLIGTRLRVRPRINHDRTVTLHIEHSATTLNPDGATLRLLSGSQLVATPIDTVTTSSITGTVVARHGLTLVMGGLVRESLGSSVDKVPLLGDIPFLGALFRDSVERAERNELIVLFTPWLLDDPADTTAVEALRHERLDELSRHPLNQLGPDALDIFGRDAAPRRDHAEWYVPFLAPVPQLP